MSEFERSEIIYEEGWRGQTAPEKKEPDPPAPTAGAADSGRPMPLLISAQLILCGVAALVLLLLKLMDSPAYHGFMDWYRDEMSQPVIGQEFFGSSGEAHPASVDEVTVEASADEFLPR